MSHSRVTLPADALKRLTADLRSRPVDIPDLAESTRSLPLLHHSWSSRLNALQTLVQNLESAAAPEAFTVSTYRSLEAAIDRLSAARQEILALLVALAPFDARDQPSANLADSSQGAPLRRTPAAVDILGSGLLGEVDEMIDAVLDAIEAGAEPPPVTSNLVEMVPTVPTIAVEGVGAALAVTFGMTTVPVDPYGAFSASRVFEAHKYDNGTLLGFLHAHMRSLGLQPTDDMLSMVLTSGWIVRAPDSVLAWQTLRSMILRLEAAQHVSQADLGNTGHDAAGSQDILRVVLAHLADREEALRQSRRIIDSTTRDLRRTDDAEDRAHALADIYRRLVEGPVRQYGWAMRCLAAGSWTMPPMVGTIADGLASDGWLKAALVPKLLPGIRNGQAHEALEWDGSRSIYVVEGVDVDYERVNIAVADCLSFAFGCEAALVHWQALAVDAGEIAPAAGQPGRMAEWRRVEALFGTNGLRVNTFKFNALRLEARIERLDIEDINPSLQAFVHARQLLPHVESFAYFIDEPEVRSDPVIEVDAVALDATHPVWLHGRDRFDAMPLSTFLPANLNARLRHEPAQVAVRAAAWIAADDALSGIDWLPVIWDEGHIWLANARVEHARLALKQTIPMVEQPGLLETLAELLDTVQAELGVLRPNVRADQVDLRIPIVRLRALWTAWGPVPRIPGIESDRGDGSPGYHSQPQRRTASPHERWTKM